MKGKSKVTVGLVIGITLFLIGLPLLEVCAEPKPQGTLKPAQAFCAQEAFLGYYGENEQTRVWPLIYEYPFYGHEETREYMPGLALRGEYSKDVMNCTMNLLRCRMAPKPGAWIAATRTLPSSLTAGLSLAERED
jgi:hypothetical protein